MIDFSNKKKQRTISAIIAAILVIALIVGLLVSKYM